MKVPHLQAASGQRHWPDAGFRSLPVGPGLGRLRAGGPASRASSASGCRPCRWRCWPSGCRRLPPPLLIAPSLVTNLWRLQPWSGVMAMLRRSAGMQLGIVAGTLLGAWCSVPRPARGRCSRWGWRWPAMRPEGLLGRSLALPARHERWLGPVVGALTGAITALDRRVRAAGGGLPAGAAAAARRADPGDGAFVHQFDLGARHWRWPGRAATRCPGPAPRWRCWCRRWPAWRWASGCASGFDDGVQALLLHRPGAARALHGGTWCCVENPARRRNQRAAMGRRPRVRQTGVRYVNGTGDGHRGREP